MSKDPIPSDITLKRLQDYIWQMNIDRSFNAEDASKKLVMLIEEVGELAKAVRKTAGLKFTETTKQTELAEELADVQIVLLGLASLTGIDMRKAVAEKEAKNRQRKWL
jgi:NTP pyrophosphatase (non-canonical NTP hydrolase)